jgi:hypothetical protein
VSRAAVRAGRRPVGIDTNHLGFNIRNVILARRGSAGIDRGHARSHTHRVSSDIGNDARAQAHDPSVAPGCELGILNLVASMRCREKALTSSFCPGARASRAKREKRTEDILCVKTKLGSKPAANIGSHKA